jgi:hypothetical protein
MKSMKWAAVVTVCVALGFAGGVFAAAAKKEMAVTPAADVKWQSLDPKDTEGKGPQMSVVFGDPKKKGSPLGFLLKVPAGVAGAHTHTSDYWAVEIKGNEHNFTGADEGPALGPGSTWFQPGKQVHNNHCEAGECVVFIYTPNGFDYQPAAEAKPAGEKPAK